jgi:hypothetical protein
MDETILFIKDKSGKYSRESYLKKNYNELYLEILKYCEINNINNISFQEKLYCFKSKIYNHPICQNINCKNNVKFIDINNGYRKYCSKKCCASDINIKEKHKQTNLEKYGYENVFQVKNVKDKIKQTNLKKYEVENPQQNDLIKKKTTLTNLERYGVEHVLQSEQFKNKFIKTNLERYGVDNPSKLKKFKDKAKKTNLKKYGVDNSSKLKKNKDKAKKTNLEKYGVDNPSKLKKFKDKAKKTNLERYGVEFFTQTQNYLEKRNTTYLKYMFKKIDNLVEIDNDNNYIVKCDCEKEHVYITNNKLYYQRKNSHTVQCTICNPINNNSGLELLLLNFIKDNYNGNIIENDRNILNGKELDIYLPELNLAFELNGIYWHNELYKDKFYHFNKTNMCHEKNIQLIHIYEDEWIKKQEIVKSMILNKLRKTSNKIYARKTEIKEITDNVLIKNFLNENHLQGNVASKIKIGLFHNDKLISLMTFGTGRKFMNTNFGENKYEMIRFCNILNTNVIGGASKLFKYFVEKYNPKEVISYADRSHSNGNLYKQLGFEQIRITNPNYYYVINGERKHRFGFRKDVLVKQGFDKNKTEHEIMLERKIFRIFNSGNLKFMFINKSF